MVSLRSSTEKKSLFDGRKMWFFFAAASALISAGVIFSLLSAVSSTASYWMIREGVTVAARQSITPDMLVEVNVPREGAPLNTVTLAQISAAADSESLDDDFFALYTLTAGDIITKNNVSTLVGMGSADMPEGTVLASFKASPSSAAGGMIKEGNYIDIAIVYQIGSDYYASFILSKVQVVKATADLDGASSAEDVAGSALGAPVLYTVAVSPKQAAALAIATKYTIYVVLTNENMKSVEGVRVNWNEALNGITFQNNSTSPVPSPTPSENGTSGTNDGTNNGTTEETIDVTPQD